MSKVRGFWKRRERWRRITKLMARDGAGCSICGEPLERTVRDPDGDRYITFDHIVPRSAGGTDAPSNLRLAHRLCNHERGNDPLIPEPQEEP